MIESFEGAVVVAQAIMADCDKPILDNLQRAHEHDMEHLRKARFHEGYVAGQRSMDAEHRAVAMRLRALPLDEDSHGNLSQIARAIWHSDFGWTRGACEALRDKIIELLGGVHGDDDGEDFRRGGACGDCHCGGNEQPSLVAYDQSHESSPMRQENETGITDELREWVKSLYTPNSDELKSEGHRIADHIDEQFKRICERHEAALQKTIDEMAEFREHDAAYALTERERLQRRIDVLTAKMELDYAPRKDLDKATHDVEMWRDRSEDMRMERDKLRKSLREIADHAGVPHDRDLADYSDEAVIDAIYWRIDNYYQINIDELQAQVIKYCKQRDKAREKAIDYRNLHHVMQRRLELERDEAERQCKDLQERLGRSRAEYCETCEEAETTDILRAKLDAVREALNGQR